MAKLEGVKVIDMVDGNVTKVEYNGEEYVKVDGDTKKGDLVQFSVERDATTKGAFYKVVNDRDYYEDDDGGTGYTTSGWGGPHLRTVFRKVTEIYDLIYNGEKYRKVTDRDVRESDFVVFSDEDRSYLTKGKPYEIVRFDSWGDPQIIDNDGDEFDLCGKEYEVYEKVTVTSRDNDETLKVGDYAEVIDGSAPRGFEGKKGQIVKIYKVDEDDDSLPYKCKAITGESLVDGPWSPASALRKINVTIHDGVVYREVNRKAQEGELIKIVDDSDQGSNGYFFKVGNIAEVTDVRSLNGDIVADFNGQGNEYVYDVGRWWVANREYVVLEPLTETDTDVTEKLYAIITTMNGDEYHEEVENIDEINGFIECVYMSDTIYLPNNDIYITAHNVATIKPLKVS